MEESSKKRSRKSKLVPRAFIDVEIEDKQSKSLQEAKLAELPQTNTEINNTEETDCIAIEEPTMRPPIQFSVAIEVEECDSDLIMDDGEEPVLVIDESESSSCDYSQVNDQLPGTSIEEEPLSQFVTSEDVIRREVEKLSKVTTCISDKILEIEIRNSWGKFPLPIVDGVHESLIQGAIYSWRLWYCLSKIRETILTYKCYVCYLGWWNLMDFREHIVEHSDIKVDIEMHHHECNMVAFIGEQQEVKHLPIKGNCWRCTKSSDFHTILRHGALYYTCEACHDHFFTCSSLVEHEGVCQGYSKMFFKDEVAFESNWKCNICQVNCLSESRYNAHLASRHDVRSDEPIAVSLFKSCAACLAKYTVYKLHVCPKKSASVQCKFCCRKFQSRELATIHETFTESNASCRICMVPFKKQCMEMEHMLEHTKNYIRVFKCNLCTELILFPNQECMRKHRVIWHGKIDYRRPSMFEMMIVPSSIKKIAYVEQLDIVASVHGKLAASNPSEDLSISGPMAIDKKKSSPAKVHAAILDDTQKPLNAMEIVEDDIDEMEAENRLIETQLVAQLLSRKEDKRDEALDEDDDLIEVEYIEPEIIEIKDEDDDYEEYDKKADEIEYDPSLKIKKEDEYNETLTKVFQGSQTITGTLVSSDDIIEELIVKEEPEEYYEDDMIMLNYDFDITDSVKHEESTYKKIEDNADNKSTKGTESNSEECNLEPEIILLDGLKRIYRKKKTYKCNKCSFEGIHKDYKAHVKTSCPPRYHRSYKFKQPKVDPNNQIAWEIFPCTKCDSTFSSIKTYILHFSTHGLTYNSCPQCLTVSDTLSALISHLFSHVRQSFVKIQLIKVARYVSSRLNGVYQCVKCRDTVSFQDFFTHWEGHLEINKKEDSLDMDETGGSRSEGPRNTGLPAEKLKEVVEVLQRSVHRIRGMADMRLCVVCRRKFERRNDCKRHLVEHLLLDAYANKPMYGALRCQVCHENFNKAERYKRHMRDHGSLPIYNCELCDKAFSDSSNFTKHKKVHNLAALVCDICHKKFQAKISLEKHMTLHLTTSPIKCNKCECMFFTESALRKHIKSRHDKQRVRFMCCICRMKFKSLKYKWDHMWEVHQERTTKADCPICNRSFRKFLDVKTHMKMEHKQSITMKAFHKKMFNSVLLKIKWEKESLEKLPKNKMIVPSSFMKSSHVEQLDNVASVHGKFVASNHSEDVPISGLMPIDKKKPSPAKVHAAILDDTQKALNAIEIAEDDTDEIEAENRLSETQLDGELLRRKEYKRDEVLDEKDVIIEVNYIIPEIIELKDKDDNYKDKADENEWDPSLKIKKEDDYNDTLTKVFQGSQTITGTVVSSDDILEELIVKEEPDEYYEDDIIILNYDLDITDSVKHEKSTYMKREENISNADNNSTKGTELNSAESNLEPGRKSLVGLKRIYRKKKTYKCNKCSFEGIHRDYKAHVKTSCPPRNHQSYKFKKPKAYPNKQIAWKIFPCTKCDSTFLTIETYILHFSTHGLTYNSCPQCLTGYDNVSALISHLFIHVRQSFVKIQLIKQARFVSSRLNGVYECVKCRATVRFQNFFTHWERHLEIRRKEDCVDRVETGGSRSEDPQDIGLPAEKLKEVVEVLQRNWEKGRGTGEAKLCVVCRRMFDRPSERKRHLIEHLLLDAYAKKPTYGSLRCQMCHENFNKPERYKQHMRDHASLAVYKCELCDKSFSDSSNFAKHKKVHNLEAVACDICHKKFQLKISLEKHMTLHKTTSPINCNQCERMFFTESALKKHIKVRHEKERVRFRCSICHMKFESLKYKWDHMWEVHKERTTNADCQICHRSFRKFSDVKNHMKMEHNKSITMKAIHMKMFKSGLPKIKREKENPSVSDV